jgi:hypothetical protein
MPADIRVRNSKWNIEKHRKYSPQKVYWIYTKLGNPKENELGKQHEQGTSRWRAGRGARVGGEQGEEHE